MKPRNTKIRANKFKEGYGPSPAGKPETITEANTITVRSHSQMVALSPQAEMAGPVFSFHAKRAMNHLYQKYFIGKIVLARGKLQTINNMFFNKMDAFMLSEDVFSHKSSEKKKPAGDFDKDTFKRNHLWESTNPLRRQMHNLFHDAKKAILRRYEKAVLLAGSWLGAGAVQLNPVVFEVVYPDHLPGRDEIPGVRHLSVRESPITHLVFITMFEKAATAIFDDVDRFNVGLKKAGCTFWKIFKNGIFLSVFKRMSFIPALLTTPPGQTAPYVSAANPGYP